MIIFLTILHIAVSLTLIAVVLLQSGKGAEMGASFGAGGSQSVFGAGGGTTFMSKVTTSAAIIFMLTSLTLAYLSGKGDSSSIMKNKAKPVQKAPTPAAPGAPAPAPGQPAASQPAAPPQTPAQQPAAAPQTPAQQPAAAPQPAPAQTPQQKK